MANQAVTFGIAAAAEAGVWRVILASAARRRISSVTGQNVERTHYIIRGGVEGRDGLTILFGQPDDWKRATAEQLDAAFARAQIRIQGRGVKPNLPGGEMILQVGWKG